MFFVRLVQAKTTLLSLPPRGEGGPQGRVGAVPHGGLRRRVCPPAQELRGRPHPALWATLPTRGLPHLAEAIASA